MSKLRPKYENWSKLGTEQQVYRYTTKVYRYTLAKNDQKRKCTGTLSKCTGTSHPKCLKMCVFSNQFYTSNTHLIHFQFTLESLFYSIPLPILIFTSKIYHGLLSHNSNMGYDPYTNQIQGFVRVCSNPTLLPCN